MRTGTAWTHLGSQHGKPLRLLGITGDVHADEDKITMFHQARLVMGMIKRFCYSNATEVMARHMEAGNGLGPAAEEQWALTNPGLPGDFIMLDEAQSGAGGDLPRPAGPASVRG